MTDRIAERDANDELAPAVLARLRRQSSTIDVAQFLDTEADIVAYLDEALATSDQAYFAHALGLVARARGMAELARTAGVSRESLYKSLSGKGSPGFDTISKVVAALGLRLSVTRTDPAEPEAA